MSNRKILKKLACLLMALAMLASAAVAVAEEEMPTLEVFFYANTLPDVDKVAEAVSEITAETIGCKVHFNFIGTTEYDSNLPLMLASKDQMDVIWDASHRDYWGRARSGAYLDLTEMLDTVTPNLKASLEEKVWEAAKVDGGIYCVPNYKDMFFQGGFWMEKSFADQLGIDLEKTYTIADIEPWLEVIHQDPDHENSTLMLYGTNYNFPRLAMSEYFSYLYNINGFGIGARKDDPSTIVNIYASEEYANLCKLAYGWYQKGYIVEDVATRDNWGSYYTNGSGVGFGLKVGQYAPLGEVSNSLTYGADLVFVKIGDCVTSSMDALGSVYCVAAKSQYPELSLKFIEQVDTNPAVKNLMTYGIEGVQYSLVDGKVEYIDGYMDSYYLDNYKSGDMRNSYLLAAEADNKYELYEEYNSAAIPDCFVGFVPSLSDIENTVSACKSVMDEYAKLLGNGAVDPEVYLPMFLSALEEAGINDVIAELQAQYDAFLAK